MRVVEAFLPDLEGRKERKKMKSTVIGSLRPCRG